MRPTFAILPILFVAGSASGSPAPQDSWGKAGVSLAQYRQDAVDCAVEGYNLDISKSDDAHAFVRASSELDSVPGPVINQTVGTGPNGTNTVDVMADFANIQGHIIDNLRPEQRFKSIKQMQLAKISACLKERGYLKFRLTQEQRHRLTKLKFGSDQRREYLYSLASNADILASQKSPPEF